MLDWNFFELIGYAGTGLVLLSFIVTGEKRIRTINIIGCAVNLAYSLIIQLNKPEDAGMIPVIVLNGALVLIHTFYFIKGYFDKKKKLEETPDAEK